MYNSYLIVDTRQIWHWPSVSLISVMFQWYTGDRYIAIMDLLFGKMLELIFHAITHLLTVHINYETNCPTALLWNSWNFTLKFAWPNTSIRARQGFIIKVFFLYNKSTKRSKRNFIRKAKIYFQLSWHIFCKNQQRHARIRNTELVHILNIGTNCV